MAQSPLFYVLLLVGHFPALVIRMEQVVRTAAEGGTQVLPIQGLDLRILMGEPHRGLLVDAPQHVSTGLGHLRAVVDGLSCLLYTSDAADD